MLARPGLDERVDYMPRVLSGGQCQRVAIARALVNRLRLILANEPTASLDKESTLTVVDLCQEVAQDGCTIMMVTPDNRVLHAADRIVNMVDGRIVSGLVAREAAMLCEFPAGIPGFEAMTPAAPSFSSSATAASTCCRTTTAATTRSQFCTAAHSSANRPC